MPSLSPLHAGPGERHKHPTRQCSSAQRHRRIPSPRLATQGDRHHYPIFQKDYTVLQCRKVIEHISTHFLPSSLAHLLAGKRDFSHPPLVKRERSPASHPQSPRCLLQHSEAVCSARRIHTLTSQGKASLRWRQSSHQKNVPSMPAGW